MSTGGAHAVASAAQRPPSLPCRLAGDEAESFGNSKAEYLNYALTPALNPTAAGPFVDRIVFHSDSYFCWHHLERLLLHPGDIVSGMDFTDARQKGMPATNDVKPFGPLGPDLTVRVLLHATPRFSPSSMWRLAAEFWLV